ncbi:MAG: hypothetical protein ACXVDI_21615 [Ktedonobacterales bacterium]
MRVEPPRSRIEIPRLFQLAGLGGPGAVVVQPARLFLLRLRDGSALGGALGPRDRAGQQHRSAQGYDPGRAITRPAATPKTHGLITAETGPASNVKAVSDATPSSLRRAT